MVVNVTKISKDTILLSIKKHYKSRKNILILKTLLLYKERYKSLMIFRLSKLPPEIKEASLKFLFLEILKHFLGFPFPGV